MKPPKNGEAEEAPGRFRASLLLFPSEVINCSCDINEDRYFAGENKQVDSEMKIIQNSNSYKKPSHAVFISKVIPVIIR